jgi:LysM repeat protein
VATSQRTTAQLKPPALGKSSNRQDLRSNSRLDVIELSDDGDDDLVGGESLVTPSVVHPLDKLSDAELRVAFKTQPETLGSISVGSPNSGRLINGVRPPPSSLYHLVDPEHAWATQETVDSLRRALEAVARRHPDTPVLDVGHLSARSGGPLRPHRSHQSGRDVDLGLYYSHPNTRWYTPSDGDNLDVARTWTLLKTLAGSTDIEMVLLDINLQKRIESFAISTEHDTAWVHLLFHGEGVRPPLLRHSPGHATHLHLRFKNPIARRTAQRLTPLLPTQRPLERQNPSLSHVASVGETLAKLAQHYCTTMDAIRAANRMRGFQLRAGQSYVIPIDKSAAQNASGCNKR